MASILAKRGVMRANGRAVGAIAAMAGLLWVAAPAPALAQWAWKDDGGRMVYSDSPPPSSIKQSQIVRQPTTLLPTPAVAGPGSAPDGGTAPGGGNDTGAARGGPPPGGGAANPAAPPSLADRDLEYRKHQQELADASKKQAEQAARAAQQAQECERARGYIRSLESGIRISRTGADGNPEFLDDTQRSAELDRARGVADKACQP